MPETPIKIKVEEEESTSYIPIKSPKSPVSPISPISPTKSSILSPYKIKKEIVTLDESSIKKENKLEINENLVKMDMSPNKEIKIKKEIESSLTPEINNKAPQEWVDIHQNISNYKFKGQSNVSSDQGIDFEENQGEYFLFYWIDAMENLGTVYLLGKVNIVINIFLNIYMIF